MIAPATIVRIRFRAAIEACVWLLLAAAALETWLLAGIAVPCRVVGDSMAETLLGAHREIRCADCGHSFVCGVDRRSARTQAVCPNCGYAANDLTSQPELDGDRLLIDRTAFSLRSPRRWEIAALQHPQRSNELLVKRVVGLPGEIIEIRNGDVYADVEIQRKTLAEQHGMAILVHDANHRPTLKPTPRPRWRPEQRESRWKADGNGFSHSGSDKIDWLVYHHERRVSGPQPSYVASPITDICGYNQSQPRRDEDIHAVSDVLLSFQLTVGEFSQGDLYVRVTDGDNCFEIQLQFARQCQGWMRYRLVADRKPTLDVPERVAIPQLGNLKQTHLIEVSLFDQQFLFAMDGQTLMAWPYERRKTPTPPSTPLAIGTQGLKANIQNLRVYRDVYYTPPVDAPAAEAIKLADDEYFVLGDNSSVSDDSRNWIGRGNVSSKSLMGKPLAAIPSLEVTPWQGRHFQVPNLRRIRYIQ